MNPIILKIQICILLLPALVTFIAALFISRGKIPPEQRATKWWAFARRYSVVLFLCWGVYLGLTWVALHGAGLFESNAPDSGRTLLAALASRLGLLSVGVLSVAPLLASVALYLPAQGWADRTLRAEEFSLLSYLKVNFAIWLWCSGRYLAIVALLMSETFFLGFDGERVTLDPLASIIIVLVISLVFIFIFPFTQRIFRLAVPVEDAEVNALVSRFAGELGVAVKGVYRMRTFGFPLANGFATTDGKIYLTDRVLDDFDADDRAAITAHEVAHLKLMRGRIWIMVAATGIIALLVLGLFPLVLNRVPNFMFVYFFSILGFYLVILVTTLEKRMQRKDEARADELAAGMVGRENYCRMLETLHAINMVPKEFSEKEKRGMSHPSCAERKNNLDTAETPVISEPET